jgi:RNase adaptor protein for sRNA GlmZ degradation
LRFEIYLEFDACNLEFNLLFLAIGRSIKPKRYSTAVKNHPLMITGIPATIQIT